MELVLSGLRISVERASAREGTRRTGWLRREPETPLTRALRFERDRAALTFLDPRLLDDVGLTEEDVARGVPFREPAGRTAR